MGRYTLFGILVLGCVMILTFFGSNKTDNNVQLHISAASSLTEALQAIGGEYNKTSEEKLIFNFAGSGSLKLQIEEGAPCDIFISASNEHMKDLENKGTIDEKDCSRLLKNTLVLIGSEEASSFVGIETLENKAIERIAVGTPESVPAGRYAIQALEALDKLKQVEHKLILAKDVRTVLEYVETGNADCGFVYQTDAALMKSGVMIEPLSETLHEPIFYMAGLLKDSRNRKEAERFYEFLKSDISMEIFKKYGFTVE